MFGNQYKMVIVKNLGTQEDPLYEQIRQLNVDIKKDSKTWKGKTFFYTLKEISYRKGRKHFIYKDIDTGDAVLTGRAICAVPPDDVDEKNEKALVKAAVKAAESPYGLAMLILALVAGLGIGAVIMVIAYPYAFPEMVKHTAQAAAKVSLWLH